MILYAGLVTVNGKILCKLIFDINIEWKIMPKCSVNGNHGKVLSLQYS